MGVGREKEFGYITVLLKLLKLVPKPREYQQRDLRRAAFGANECENSLQDCGSFERSPRRGGSNFWGSNVWLSNLPELDIH